MRQFISQFHGEESGQDMLEYALVLAAVLTAVVAGSTTLSSTITQHPISTQRFRPREPRRRALSRVVEGGALLNVVDW
jgi:Flp pilus assembly pilin Flp